MPTQYDRRDLATMVRDAVQYAIDDFDNLPQDTQRSVEPFRDTQITYDDFHPNVVYLRLADGSTFQVTLRMMSPPVPPRQQDRQAHAPEPSTRRNERRGGRSQPAEEEEEATAGAR